MERALQFQRNLKFSMGEYQELCKQLEKPEKQMLITTKNQQRPLITNESPQ